MNKKRFRRISPLNLPVGLPIWPTVIIYLLLDRFQLDNFWWGSISVLLIILWGYVIYFVINQENVDLIGPVKGPTEQDH